MTSRLLDRVLFATGRHDPYGFPGAGSVLALVSLVAAFLPARDASQVDPMRILREE